MLNQVLLTFHKLFEHMPVQNLIIGRSQKVYKIDINLLYIVLLAYIIQQH